MAQFMRDRSTLDTRGLLKEIGREVDAATVPELSVSRGAHVRALTRLEHLDLHAIGAHGLAMVVGRPEGQRKSNGGSGDHLAGP